MDNATFSAPPEPPEPPRVAEWFQALIFLALTLTFLVGTIGNGLVVHIIQQRKKRRSIHLLTLNLAISDLFVLLIYLPMQMYTIHTHLEWHFGKSLCRAFYLLNSCSVNASIGTLVAITRDRYIAVMKPIKARSRTTTFVKYWIVLIWLFSFILTVPLILVADAPSHYGVVYCTESWPENTHYERIYWISVFVLQFVLPLTFITASYAIIVYHVKQSQPPAELLKSNDNNNNNGRRLNSSRRTGKRKKQQNKMLKMSIVLVVVYAVCVLPQHSVFFAYVYGNLEGQSYSIFIFITSNFLMLVNSAINPVVYGTLNDEMKRGFLKMLFCEHYNLLESFRNSFQRLRLRKRATTNESTNTTTSSNFSSPRKTSVQFDLTPVTRIDNL